MSKILLESDFLTVDIQSLFNNQKDAGTTAEYIDGQWQAANGAVVAKGQSADNKPVSKTITDWGNELKARLDTNRHMSQESRKTEYEIETEFFKEYFYAFWAPDIAEQLQSIGDPLKKALKVLGFKKQTNPILAFISHKYVQTNLLQTKLLNASTFRAIYNAVANKLVADSEFLKVSDYNIIYCQDLYKKPAAEIEKYLAQQKNILSVSASRYTVEDQQKNKATFFYIKKIKELDVEKRKAEIARLYKKIELPSAKNASTVLNSLSLVQAIAGTKPSADIQRLNTEEQTALANKLSTAAQIFAALQFLSINAASKKAASALSSNNFKSLSSDQLAQATIWLVANGIMPKGGLVEADADKLAGVLLSRLQELK